MQLELRVRHADLEDALHTYLERRFRFALGRFADHVGLVTVRIHDVNGPRGGVDKQCRIMVTLIPRGGVQLEETSPDVLQAVDHAAHRLSRCVQRRLERSHEALAR